MGNISVTNGNIFCVLPTRFCGPSYPTSLIDKLYTAEVIWGQYVRRGETLAVMKFYGAYLILVVLATRVPLAPNFLGVCYTPWSTLAGVVRADYGYF